MLTFGVVVNRGRINGLRGSKLEERSDNSKNGKVMHCGYEGSVGLVLHMPSVHISVFRICIHSQFCWWKLQTAPRGGGGGLWWELFVPFALL